MAKLCSNKDCRAELPEGRKLHYCRDCAKERNRQYESAHPGDSRQRTVKWRKDNAEALRERNNERARETYPTKAAYFKTYRHEYNKTHRAEMREYARQWYSQNPEKGRAGGHRYRARKKGCEVSAVDLHTVVERSKGICAMCCSWVPRHLRHIDHIVPLDKGGPHSIENLQLLCYRCNTRKGNKLPNEVTPDTWTEERAEGQPFLFNPDWSEMRQ